MPFPPSARCKRGLTGVSGRLALALGFVALAACAASAPQRTSEAQKPETADCTAADWALSCAGAQSGPDGRRPQ